MYSLKLYYEKDKKGKFKYYFLHPQIPVSIYLKPVDKTTEEILRMLVLEGKYITEWEVPEYMLEEEEE